MAAVMYMKHRALENLQRQVLLLMVARGVSTVSADWLRTQQEWVRDKPRTQRTLGSLARAGMLSGGIGADRVDQYSITPRGLDIGVNLYQMTIDLRRSTSCV